MILLIISFLAGILTILAPCVLPVLPVIIGGSIGGGRKQKNRPYIIAAALAGSIIGFTLLLKLSTILINLSPKVLTYTSGVIIILLGMVSVFPEAWERFFGYSGLQAASQRFLGAGSKEKNKFVGPILIGLALGPVFSSCSPTYAFILASVLPKNFTSGLFYLIAYSLGLVLTLLAVSLAGRKAIARYTWAIDTHSLFRRLLGVLFVLIGIAILFGWDIKIETWVGNHTPFDEAKIEQRLLAKQTPRKYNSSSAKSGVVDSSLFNIQPTPEPELAGLTNWINSPPLTLASLKGKVVLVDFWTYSCINCLRTLPYVENWYQTYHDKGLVIIGVHTPEFAFEHVPANVQAAVKAHKITYPVALDNDLGTWNAFDNNSWPADYLIDKDGNIRNVHLGEGDYDKTEAAIQTLLGQKVSKNNPTTNVPITDIQTPETYFGTGRAENYSGSPDLAIGDKNYTADNSLGADQWTLGGNWQVAEDKITSGSAASSLTFHVHAKDVYMVAGSPNDQPTNLTVEVPNNAYGEDVSSTGQLTIGGSRLYHIASFKSAADATIKLTVPPGVSLYTFTFGS